MPDPFQQIRDRYSEADKKWENEGNSNEEGYAMGIEFVVYKLDELYPGLAERVWPNE
jgi:hypothetical protein